MQAEKDPSVDRIAPGGDDEAKQLSDGWVRRRQRIAAKIESTAWRLFAERTYSQVTVEEIAAASGCSIRTVTRHFPAKEDLLLDFQRRKNRVILQAFAELAPTDDPVPAIWATWPRLADREGESLAAYAMWGRAAETAPEVMHRAHGERRSGIQAALTALLARSLGTDPDNDVQVHVMAAMLESANSALVDYWLSRGGVDDLGSLYETVGRLPRLERLPDGG
ncbi:TetR/AcrR family transcriptional regulator [Cryptosporangium aurantiacum]|uniref:Transcriptional regulator, TetR family n=1 Tax=Cryptosporangium aurantiacum TaxID=134849 RepID=A0A1M7PQH2_9ACTN|nr:TetR/AcrR family transcriptional regulator [Cryptosporangium aurantiacum]SHN19583.1 transcriptional regulator, TetR family [Cryptosporangium aurantiacum]